MKRSGTARRPAPQDPGAVLADWLGSCGRHRPARAVLAWYSSHKRDLPWRRQPTLWSAWVSEIMLQQTRTEVVREYWPRFLARFPDVQSLAAAPESEVLRLWEGLGYYRRARLLHAAAREVVCCRGGELPGSVGDWLTLPGVGRYTAHAILSIADGQTLPIVEANTRRLYARLLGWREALTSSRSDGLFWRFANSLVPNAGAGEFNQGLMDIGSLICTPRKPDCPNCPLKTFCRASREGTTGQIPPKAIRPETRTLRFASLVAIRRGRVLVRQCGPDEWWAGLWDFPRCQIGEDSATRAEGFGDPAAVGESPGARAGSAGRKLAGWLRRTAGLRTVCRPAGCVFRHSVTHHRLLVEPFIGGPVTGRLRPSSGLCWISLNELEALPLSVPGRAIARNIAQWSGADPQAG